MEDYNKEDVIASLKQLPQHLRTRSLVDQRSYLIGILAYRFGMSEPQIADILGFKRSKINYNKKIVMQFYGDKMFQANVYVYAQMYPFDFSVIETVQQVQRNKRVQIDISRNMYNKLKAAGSIYGHKDIRITIKFLLDKSIRMLWEE
jgi:hypothetical protein